MNWNKTNTLRTIGSTPAVALPYEYTIERHIRNTQPKRSPLDIYGIREKLPTKLPTILGAVSLLNWCHHLSTPRNLSVVAALGTEQLTLAYAEVLVDLGLFEQSGREVQAIEEASIPIINGAVVFVRPWQVGEVFPVFNLTEEGEQVLRVQEAMAEHQP